MRWSRAQASHPESHLPDGERSIVGLAEIGRKLPAIGSPGVSDASKFSPRTRLSAWVGTAENKAAILFEEQN